MLAPQNTANGGLDLAANEDLFHAGNGGFDGVNIGAQVTAVGGSGGPGRDLHTARFLCVAQSRIFADGVFEAADASRFGG